MTMLADTKCKEKKSIFGSSSITVERQNIKLPISQNNNCRQSIYRHMAVSDWKYQLRGEIIDPVSKI